LWLDVTPLSWTLYQGSNSQEKHSGKSEQGFTTGQGKQNQSGDHSSHSCKWWQVPSNQIQWRQAHDCHPISTEKHSSDQMETMAANSEPLLWSNHSRQIVLEQLCPVSVPNSRIWHSQVLFFHYRFSGRQLDLEPLQTRFM
jgi:hypothetical protein